VPADLTQGIFVADLMRLRPSSRIIDSKFLLYGINSVVVQQQFKEITKGTTRARVNLSIVRSIKLALPPLNEQRRIVAKIEELFSELEKGIENLKQARAQLAVYRQSLLKHAFEGHLTAAWRAEYVSELESPEEITRRIQRHRRTLFEQRMAEWNVALGKWKSSGAIGKRPSKPREPEQPEKPSSEHARRMWLLPDAWQWIQTGTFAFVTKLAGFEYTDYVRYSEDGDLCVIKAENAGPEGYRVTNYSRVRSETVAQLKRSIVTGGASCSSCSSALEPAMSQRFHTERDSSSVQTLQWRAQRLLP
jgi:type I restriction enzyme S subunit